MTVYVVFEIRDGNFSTLLVVLTAEQAEEAIKGYPQWEKRGLFYQTAFMPDTYIVKK